MLLYRSEQNSIRKIDCVHKLVEISKLSKDRDIVLGKKNLLIQDAAKEQDCI